MPKQYFHVFDNQRHGPFTGVQIKQRAAMGVIQPHHRIQEDGSPKLHEARLVPGLFETPPTHAASVSRSAQPTGGERGQQPAPLTPRFRNPVSTLLNSLASLALDNMHARVSRGELTQAAFEQSGTVLLKELQSAITFAESLPDFPPRGPASPLAPPDPGAKKQTTPQPARPTGRPLTGTVVPSISEAPRGRAATSHPPQAPMAAPPAAAGSSGASALQLGAAALAGGAWGYLLARQGGMGHGMAYGHGMGDTHIHYHGMASDFAGNSLQDLAPAHHVPVNYEPQVESQPSVMGVDSDSDGLVDTFYGDSNGDGTADVMGRDADADGDLDQIAIDSDNDGTFDRTFTADDASDDAHAMSDSADDDADDQDFDSDGDEADYDAGDYDDIADVGGDFGCDVDFG